MFICCYLEVSRTDQADTMSYRKQGDELQNIIKAAQIENNTSQKKQVIITSKHVRCTYPNVSP